MRGWGAGGGVRGREGVRPRQRTVLAAKEGVDEDLAEGVEGGEQREAGVHRVLLCDRRGGGVDAYRKVPGTV